MMQKAVFLDKDGTLIKDIPFNADPNLITLESNCIKGLSMLRDKGYLLIVITNQSGIAEGYFSETDLLGVKNKIQSLLGEFNIELDGFYFCPNHPEAVVEKYRLDCDNRKPAPGMLLQAATDFNISLSHSWMIGDILHDIEAGNRAGCRSILIDNGNETEWLWNGVNDPVYAAPNINEAANYIISNSKPESIMQNAERLE